MKKVKVPEIKLPKMIREGDLKSVSYKSKFKLSGEQFEALEWNTDIELWYTEKFGWCIPTLLISSAGRQGRQNGYSDRTYGISLDGKPVRIGMGPHILKKIRVYLSKRNLERLQPLLDLMNEGKVQANVTRDRISTRRMRGYL